MEWLGQNWVWVLAALGFLALLASRGFGRHGYGNDSGGHHGEGVRPEDANSQQNEPAGINGSPGAAIDPVSGNAVRTDRALTALHAACVYYFESAETRQRFEAEPHRYAAKGSAREATETPRRRHRHGC